MPSDRALLSYLRWRDTWSDIQDHLPYLFQRAGGNVVELGTRHGVSTAALLAGIEERDGHLWSIDVDKGCGAIFAGHPDWTFVSGSSLDGNVMDYVLALMAPMSPRPLDLLFVDTLHTWAHVLKELLLWGPLVRPGGVIVAHDAVTFPDVARALTDYAQYAGTTAPQIKAGSNGLGVIEVPA